MIIKRKPSISSDHPNTKEENNNYTDMDVACSDLKNNNNNSVTVYTASENGNSVRGFEFQATVGPNGVCTMQPTGGVKYKRYLSPPRDPFSNSQFPSGKRIYPLIFFCELRSSYLPLRYIPLLIEAKCHFRLILLFEIEVRNDSKQRQSRIAKHTAAAAFLRTLQCFRIMGLERGANFIMMFGFMSIAKKRELLLKVTKLEVKHEYLRSRASI